MGPVKPRLQSKSTKKKPSNAINFLSKQHDDPRLGQKCNCFEVINRINTQTQALFRETF